MQFSDLAFDFPGTTNRLYQTLESVRRSGVEVVDLVSANVNEHGIVFPTETLAPILADAVREARVYKPDSLGQSVARDAVGAYEGVSAGNVVLTPGTSVSYWYAFRLLTSPGDNVLCPTPSYPLFDYIARLGGIEIRNYALDGARDWRIDFDSIEAAIDEQTRAIVLISPHNPTGMVTGAGEIAALADLARRRDLPIVSDEVFREFVYDGVDAARPVASDAPLVITLNGFSKMFALPGMKIGWMAVSGDSELVDRSIRTLELVSDTFLPVNEAAQFAAPRVFESGMAFLGDYRSQLHARRDNALSVLGNAVRVPPCGGFHMVVPCPGTGEDEDFAVELLESEHVLVHPGYFYDIDEPHVVISFTMESARAADAMGRLAARL